VETYSLKFTDDGLGLAKLVEFDAYDAGKALDIAHREAAGRAAELWREGEKLCTIRRTGLRGEIWQVGPILVKDD
jgi:hypothetical protein